MDVEAILAALSNATRRQILHWLKDRRNFPPPLPEHEGLEGVCVRYIQEKANLSQSTVSTYMRLLKNADLVVSERHGQWTFYRRNEPAIRAFLLQLEREMAPERSER